MDNKQWIKRAGPGQFRGQGEWREVSEFDNTEEYFDHCRETGYLPTYIGPFPPDQLAAVLVDRFPWLEADDEDVSGADVIGTLTQWHHQLNWGERS